MLLRIFFILPFVFAQNSRKPGSIPPDLDFSGSSKDSFNSSGHKLLESKIRIIKESDSLVVYLPNFILPNQEAESKGICQTYDTIKLELRPEGVAVDGEIPSVRLSAPCNIGSDRSFLSKIVIPMKQIQKVILSHSLKDKSFEVSHYLDSWPQNWKLKSINFASSTKPTDNLGLQTNLNLKSN